MDNEDTKPRFTKRIKLGLAAVALVAVGGGVGAVAVHEMRPAAVMAPANPVAIKTLTDDGSVITIKGRVAQVFGNKFVMTDGSGNALVDAGRGDDSDVTVAPGQTVTVQGRFDGGVVRARFLVGADGKVVALRGGKHERRGDHEEGRHGERGDDDRHDGDVASPITPSAPAAPVTAAPAPVATK